MKRTLYSLLISCLIAGTAHSAAAPDELNITRFAGPDLVPSPACLSVAPNGHVFVGVDLNGSLGKGPGKGRILRLVDKDHDGAADTHTIFAEIDNPRGMIPVGDRLFVLHTVIPEDTGILSGMHVSVLRDSNGDGVAEGKPERLISNISVTKHNQDRGADHTSNGIVLGIDGWIYIAVGDFGFVDATGTDGTKLTMLGGGIVRVRPDGTEMEVYTHGTRNIYDLAIDPLLNIFTRGNTNDGGGWNVRFLHHIQSGEYGYPVLFKNFTGEMLPALEDLGGGSGTGALFFAEPGWPKKYSNVPMMCDWGRNQLFIHRVTPYGPSFTQTAEDFIRISQITDVDVDGSGRMYLSAWDGAGYKGNESKGYVERVTPKGWKFEAFPDLGKASAKSLFELLKKPSAVARRHAQQELIRREAKPAPALKLAKDKSASIESRVAAIFTARQLGAKPAKFIPLATDDAIREFVLRALTDRKTQLSGVPARLFTNALRDDNPRVRVAAAVGLGRLGDAGAAEALLTVANPPEGTYEPQPDAAEVEKPAFMSKKVKPHQSADVKVDVTGWKELHLVVTDGSDGNGHDHAGWFNPVLVMADGTETKLTSLEWKSAESGWGKNLIDMDCTGKPLARAVPAQAQAKAKKQKGKKRKAKTAAASTPAGGAATGIGTHSPSHIVYALPEGAVQFKATGAATAGAVDGRGYVEYVAHSRKPVFADTTEGPHASPNSAIVLPHIAVRSLVKINAIDSCLAALDGPNRPAAIWALKSLHNPKTVDGLLARLDAEKQTDKRAELLALLSRLYQREAPYDGSWWWGTRPDTRGPYYQLAKWEKSDAIASVLLREYQGGTGSAKQQLAFWNGKLRMEIKGMGNALAADKSAAMNEPKVDIAKIANKPGEVGNAAIEDLILALDKLKGDIARGEELFTQQACVACHTTSSAEPLKGPYMGQVGAVLTRAQIAESILKPNASISQGFATVNIETKDDESLTGFISAETATDIEMRDIIGQIHRVKKSNIAERRELAISMMPEGLANALSLQDFVSLVDFLASKKK